jgi:hypothetical protein
MIFSDFTDLSLIVDFEMNYSNYQSNPSPLSPILERGAGGEWNRNG